MNPRYITNGALLVGPSPAILVIKQVQQLERIVKESNQKWVGSWIGRLNFLLPKQWLDTEQIITGPVPVGPHSKNTSPVLLSLDETSEFMIERLKLFSVPKYRFCTNIPDATNPLAAFIKRIKKLAVKSLVATSAGACYWTKIHFPSLWIRINRLISHRDDMIQDFTIRTAVNA